SDDLPGGVLIEGSGTRIEVLAGRAGDLKPPTAIEREIKLVASVGQRALHMQVAHGGRAHAKTNLRSFRNDLLPAAVRRTRGALRLVEQIGEFRPRPLKAGRVDVGDVVGYHLDVGLLGLHAGRSDG